MRSDNDKLLSMGPDGRFTSTSRSESPLTLATSGGYGEIAKFLIEKGADVNHGDSNMITPLFNASVAGQEDVARLIIEKGAEVNAANKAGDTPLIYAAFKGHTEVVRLLLEHGANVNAVTNNGSTPLILAASHGFTEIARLLVAKGADLSVAGKDGKTATDWAKSLNFTETYRAMEAAKQLVLDTTRAEELDKLLVKNDPAALRAYLDLHPEALASIKNQEMRLRYTGPAELRVIDIAQLVKDENKDPLIIAQINSIGGPYKRFTVGEISALKKMRISDEVVAAMIAVTTAFNKEQKQQISEQNRVQAIQAPVQVVQQVVQQPVQAPVQAPETNTLPECVKLAAALKACDYAGGFLTMGCKAVARSQFNCPAM